MLCASSIQAFAAEPSVSVPPAVKFSISPYMEYIVQANCNLYIDSNGIATVKSSVYGYQGTTTRVEISAKLQQYKSGSGVTIKTFTADSDSHRTNLSETYNVTKGYSYRNMTVRALQEACSKNIMMKL